MTTSDAAAVRARLRHPVLDCDGHWVESMAVFNQYLAQVGGAGRVDQFRALMKQRGALRWSRNSEAEQRSKRLPAELGAGNSGTVDLATAMLPGLMFERMPELGIDLSLIYPSMGLGLLGVGDTQLRLALVRAYNTMAADVYGPYRKHLLPVAIVPTQTPGEAIAEAQYAVRELGFRAIMIFGAFPRPVPGGGGAYEAGFALESFKRPYYVDALGLDDDSYDPFFRTCMELRVAVTSHAGATDWADRRSISNNMFNHIGHFAQANHVFAKALFLGGVVRRFPELNFAFLEGGVGYAISLLWDLLGHFEKFNEPSLLEHYDPARTDFEQLGQLFARHAPPAMRDKLEEVLGAFNREPLQPQQFWARAQVQSEAEIVEQYRKNYYFGCEADDPATAFAFDRKRGIALNTVFSSDLSHPDVPVMTHVLPEAYELVEKGLLSEPDFAQFAFGNGVRLHGRMNPDFFVGTAIEAHAAELLASDARARADRDGRVA